MLRLTKMNLLQSRQAIDFPVTKMSISQLIIWATDSLYREYIPGQFSNFICVISLSDLSHYIFMLQNFFLCFIKFMPGFVGTYVCPLSSDTYLLLSDTIHTFVFTVYSVTSVVVSYIVTP